MLPQYSSIHNQDNEKQPLQEYSCPCAAANATTTVQCQHDHHQKRKPSKWTVITLGVLGFLFISHITDSHHYHYHYDSNDAPLSVKNNLYNDEENGQLLNDQGWGIHCFGSDYPNIPWDGKSVYDSPDHVKSLTLNHKRSSNNGFNVYSKVRNKKKQKRKLNEIKY